jgi:2-polyprenyl-6-methoxyphenol hydroxylase-like FAD-dependent oxidoreductase
MSTFLVECSEKTFFAAGFDKMSEDETRAALERIFAQTLDGHSLISNRSIWRQFPIIHNERWSAGNKVILGDALHTAHFSIGSGTRLAFEDAIVLARAICTHLRDVPAALAAYQAERKPILDKLVNAANASAQWYENFGKHMALPPYDFAMSYLSRTGRMDIERIRKVAPKFVAEWEKRRQGAA